MRASRSRPRSTPTFATPRTSPYDIFSSHLGSHSSTAASTGCIFTIEFSPRRPPLNAVCTNGPVRREPQPERAEVCEHELGLRRLAEDAHVRGAAVPDEVARAGRVAAVLGALRVSLLRLLDLAGDGGDQDVPSQPHPVLDQRRTAST